MRILREALGRSQRPAPEYHYHFKNYEDPAMPTTINVGLSKKLGLSNYGSIGASCTVTFETAHNPPDRDGFQHHVKQAFDACRQAVDDELGRQQKSATAATDNSASAPPRSETSASHNGNGHHASAKQMTYVQQLARQIEGLGVRQLETLATNMFGKALVDLTSLDASRLIDALKGIKAGEIDLNAALDRANR